jgi:hypothetical protein
MGAAASRPADAAAATRAENEKLAHHVSKMALEDEADEQREC